jgi:hypothetical protein
VCSAVSEEIFSNSCATCISHTISHGTIKPSIRLHLVQEIRAESAFAKARSPGRPSACDSAVERVRNYFQRSQASRDCIALMMKAASTSETSVFYTILHDAISQKTIEI